MNNIFIYLYKKICVWKIIIIIIIKKCHILKKHKDGPMMFDISYVNVSWGLLETSPFADQEKKGKEKKRARGSACECACGWTFKIDACFVHAAF